MHSGELKWLVWLVDGAFDNRLLSCRPIPLSTGKKKKKCGKECVHSGELKWG